MELLLAVSVSRLQACALVEVEVLGRIFSELAAIRERLDGIEGKMIPVVEVPEEEMRELRKLLDEVEEGDFVPWEEMKKELEEVVEVETVDLYRVRVHEKAKRSLENVPDKTRRQILDLFSVLRDVPFPPERFDARRMDDASSFVRVWIGDYKVDYEIDLEEALVSVGRITRRSDVSLG